MHSVSIAKIEELKFDLIEHPPYSADLAPNDFFLLPDFLMAQHTKIFVK